MGAGGATATACDARTRVCLYLRLLAQRTLNGPCPTDLVRTLPNGTLPSGPCPTDRCPTGLAASARVRAYLRLDRVVGRGRLHREAALGRLHGDLARAVGVHHQAALGDPLLPEEVPHPGPDVLLHRHPPDLPATKRRQGGGGGGGGGGGARMSRESASEAPLPLKKNASQHMVRGRYSRSSHSLPDPPPRPLSNLPRHPAHRDRPLEVVGRVVDARRDGGGDKVMQVRGHLLELGRRPGLGRLRGGRHLRVRRPVVCVCGCLGGGLR